MGAENEIPILLQLMFGEAAALAQGTASERLLRWCQAMDDWLVERKRKNSASTYRTSMNVWRQLLSGCAKPPWEITPEDIRQYRDWLQTHGHATGTIKGYLSTLSIFYTWCDQRHIDPACGQAFNPVAEIPRPKVVEYAKAKVLSRAEARALLAILEREQSIIGRRDYAFFLARLMIGIKLKYLQQLQWGQIEQDDTGVWLLCGSDQGRLPFPIEVWGAICAYLQASGRLVSIQSEDYIFAPLRDPLIKEACGKAVDWNETRYLGIRQINASLKLYGKLAGIPDEKLTLPALRHTAVLLRQKAGDSLEQLQTFLGSEAQLCKTKYYLRRLPPMPRNGERPMEEDPTVGDAQPPLLPQRKPRRKGPGEGITHGYYAQKQPIEEVQAMLAEDICGMEAEIIGLRTLSRALLERQNQVHASGELAQLSNAYTLAADRLREMIKAEEQLQKTSDEDEWAEAVLNMLDDVEVATGGEPISEQVRQEAAGSDPEMAAGARRLTEEIASARLVLRRSFSLTLEAQSVREQVRYTDIYGNSCIRLVRLLKAEKGAQSRLADYLREAIDAAILEVNKEWGFDLPS